MNIAAPTDFEPDPIEIDPRPCELCGFTIDRHEMIDDGDGPIFFCPDLSPGEMTLPELERRAELRREEEVAAIMARMEAWEEPAGVAPPRASETKPYRTAQSTIDTFWFVVRLGDADRLTEWFSQHPLDAPYLCELWERKNAQS